MPGHDLGGSLDHSHILGVGLVPWAIKESMCSQRNLPVAVLDDPIGWVKPQRSSSLRNPDKISHNFSVAHSDPMNSTEWRATGALSFLYVLRMLGLFMVMPILALYVKDMPGGATAEEIGLAIGIYGLLQGCLQIPMGVFSDRYGRKPLLVIGMLVFAAGSVLAGFAHDVHWIILGRALQGAGVISSTASAMLADVTRASVRTKAMTVVGIGMGMSFLLALFLGPLLAGVIGVNGIFLATGGLAVVSIPVFLLGVPTVPRMKTRPGSFREALHDRQSLRLDFGIFCMDAMMTALFIAAPFAIEKTYGLSISGQWKLYLPVLFVSILPVFPFIGWAEVHHRMREGIIGSVVLLGVSLALAAVEHGNRIWFAVALALFFAGINFVEGSLPSLISRRAPEDRKGAALGVYFTFQYIGAFIGSAIAGAALGAWGVRGVFACAALIAPVWLVFAWGTRVLVKSRSAAKEEEMVRVE